MSSKQENKKRRDKGEGAIFKRGKYFYYRNRALNIEKSLGTDNETQARKIVREKYLPIVEASSREEIAAHVAVAKKIISKKDVPVKGAWKKFIDSPARKDLSSGTIEAYSSRWSALENWMKSKGLDDLQEIDDNTAKEFASHLTKEHLAPKTYNDYLINLGIIFDVLFAGQYEYVNPWRKGNIARRSVEYQSRTEFTEAELWQVLGQFHKEGYQIDDREQMETAFHVGAWTGLRLKDACLIKWEHVNVDKGLISVIPYKTRKKTNNRVWIALHPKLREQLEAAKQWDDGSGYIVPVIAKRYQHKDGKSLRNCVQRVFKAAGLETKRKREKGRIAVNQYGFSSFRHTFISFCADAGIPLSVVQSIVGHTTPAVTRYYIHTSQESLEKAVSALPGGGGAMTEKQKLEKIKGLISGKKKLSKLDKEILDLIKN